MKRLSSGTLALLATLLFAIPTESQAFFGFFGGGFSFGFGSGWGWGGPGWYSPYWGHDYWHYPYWRRHRWGYPFWRRHWPYPHYGLYSPYYTVPTVTVPAVKAPETSKAK